MLLILWGPLLAAAEGEGPRLDPLSGAHVAQMVLMLLLVLGLILLFAWLLRRMGRFGIGNRGAIRYLGALAVGQRERVVLIQVGETQLLLGVAQGRVSMLHRLESPIDIEQESAPFGVQLKALLQQQRGERR